MTASYLMATSAERLDIHSLFEDCMLERVTIQNEVDTMIRRGHDVSAIREANNRISSELRTSLISI